MGIARSGIGWLIAKYGSFVLSFVALMYFTRALPNPTKTLGLFQVFETMVGFAMLFISSSVGSALVKRISESDGKESERYAGAGAVVASLALVLSVAVVLVFWGQIVSYFSIGAAAPILLLSVVVLLTFRQFGGALLEGTSRVGQSGFVEFVETSGKTILQIALVFLGFELLGLVGGAVIGATFAAATAVKLSPIGIARPERRHVEQLLSFGKFSLLNGFAGKFYNHIDTVLIAYFLSSSAVSLYNVPFRFALVLSSFAGAINVSSMPEVSKHAAHGDTERVKEILTDGIVFSTLLAVPATVGVALLARPIIVTLFTAEFAAGATVAIIVIALQVPNGLRTTFVGTLNGIDRPDLTVRANVLLVAINALLDLLLIPRIGIEGAAIASFTAITVTSGYMGYVVFSRLGLSYRAFPARELAQEGAAACVMGGVVYILRETVSLPQTLKVAFLISVGVLIYVVALLAISASIRRRIYGIVADILPRWLLNRIPEPQESDR